MHPIGWYGIFYPKHIPHWNCPSFLWDGWASFFLNIEEERITLLLRIDKGSSSPYFIPKSERVPHLSDFSSEPGIDSSYPRLMEHPSSNWAYSVEADSHISVVWRAIVPEKPWFHNISTFLINSLTQRQEPLRRLLRQQTQEEDHLREEELPCHPLLFEWS